MYDLTDKLVGGAWLERATEYIHYRMREAADNIILKAQSTTPVDSRALYNSYHAEEVDAHASIEQSGMKQPGRKYSVLIKNVAPHAAEVELKEPFLGPVVSSQEIHETLKDKIKQALKEALTHARTSSR